MRDLGQILIEQGIGEQFREALEGTAPTTLPALAPVPAFEGNREQRRAAARGKAQLKGVRVFRGICKSLGPV